TDSWTPTSTAENVPAARFGHTALWTGREMIVWGGIGTPSSDGGGRYSPFTDRWIVNAATSAFPAMKSSRATVFTGDQMIGWGSPNGSPTLDTGTRYCTQALTAATLYYVGPDNGSWNSAANWSLSAGGSGGAGVPTDGDTARVDVTSTTNVTFD